MPYLTNLCMKIVFVVICLEASIFAVRRRGAF